MSLKHGGSQALYRARLQVATRSCLLFCFRKTCDIFVLRRVLMCTMIRLCHMIGYGLHSVLPQFVPLTPPSARATGVTIKVWTNKKAAARVSSVRFTMVFSLGIVN